jgi:hypothetical protein
MNMSFLLILSSFSTLRFDQAARKRLGQTMTPTSPADDDSGVGIHPDQLHHCDFSAVPPIKQLNG